MNLRAIFFLLIFVPFTGTANPKLNSHANFNTAGISVDIDALSDPNRNAVAIIERRDGNTFKRGLKLTRTSASRFIGSIFHLSPGTRYDVRVVMSDPDGGPLDGLVLNTSITTRSEIEIPEALKTYIVSPNGRGNSCTSALPCALKTGISRATAGEHVVLLDGIYYTGNINMPQSGTESLPIVIRAANNAKAILDGALPRALRWVSIGGGTYQTRAPFDDIHLVVANGQRLLAYQNLDDVRNLHWGIPGAFSDDRILSVRLKNNANPNNESILVSRYNTAFIVKQDNVYFEGLSFRHYGRGDFAKAIYIDGGNNNLVSNSTFALNNTSVAFKRAAGQNVVQDNVFTDTLFDWPWAAFKTSGRSDPITEAAAVEFYAPTSGKGNVIRRNTISDVFDGISVCPSDTAGVINETDVHDNIIYRAGDDAIAADGLCSNVRLWRNTLHDTLVGISVAPAEEGPTYAIGNVIYNIGAGNNDFPGTAFKFNSGGATSGVIYLYHNTVDARTPNTSALEVKTPGTWDAIVALNNIWSGTDYSIENVNTSQIFSTDFNNHYSTKPGRLIRWGDSRYPDLPSFTSEVGKAPNSLNIEPSFVSPNSATPDYRLSPNSGLIDRGAFIFGINDNYIGRRPDMGHLSIMR